MSERGKGFPRLSLASAVNIIESASKFGRTWKREQFAGFGAKNNAASARSGAFAARISSLRDYGLVTSDKDSISLTELGLTISKPVTASEREKAIRKAFLSVETFSNLYASFDSGEPLPTDKIAEHAVFNLGISRDSKDKFVNNFIDSGEFVGLVRYNKDDKSITLVKSHTADDSGEDADNGEVVPTAASIETASASALIQEPLIARTDVGSRLTNEQGVNHAGEGWTLTVLLKSSNRLGTDVRKKVRELLELADEVADELYKAESE